MLLASLLGQIYRSTYIMNTSSIPCGVQKRFTHRFKPTLDNCRKPPLGFDNVCYNVNLDWILFSQLTVSLLGLPVHASWYYACINTCDFLVMVQIDISRAKWEVRLSRVFQIYVHFVIVLQIFRQLGLLFISCWNSCLLFKLRFTLFGETWCYRSITWRRGSFFLQESSPATLVVWKVTITRVTDISQYLVTSIQEIYLKFCSLSDKHFIRTASCC